MLREDNVSWLDMPFLRFTEERGYIVLVANNVAQFVDFSSRSFPAASLIFVTFD